MIRELTGRRRAGLEVYERRPSSTHRFKADARLLRARKEAASRLADRFQMSGRHVIPPEPRETTVEGNTDIAGRRNKPFGAVHSYDVSVFGALRCTSGGCAARTEWTRRGGLNLCVTMRFFGFPNHVGQWRSWERA